MQERLGLSDSELASNVFLLERLINSASGMLEMLTGRNLASRTYANLEIDGNGRDVLLIPRKYIPITALTALTLKTSDLGTSESVDVSTSNNELRWTSWGRMTLYPDAGWNVFPPGHRNVLVSFTGGLSSSLTDPSYALQYEVAREACEMLVTGKWFSLQRDPQISSMKVDDVSVSYGDSKEVSDYVKELKILKIPSFR